MPPSVSLHKDLALCVIYKSHCVINYNLINDAKNKIKTATSNFIKQRNKMAEMNGSDLEQ